MPIGIKIMPNSLEDYNEIVSILKSENLIFFIHPIKDNQKFKLVLYEDEKFKSMFNIEPLSTKEIQTSRSNANDDVMYIVEFNKNQITKREIRKIKYFCGITVMWRNPLLTDTVTEWF